MPNSFDAADTPAKARFNPRSPHFARFLWVNLTSQANTPLGDAAGAVFDVRRVRQSMQIPGAIRAHAPQFLCFEFDEPSPPDLAALAHTRREHPGLPVLLITGCSSEAVAIWALRIRVWDFLVKPVSLGELSQRIAALIESTRQRGHGPEQHSRFAPQDPAALPVADGDGQPLRTQCAIELVRANFGQRIGLDHVAALCQLSPSRFCRVFRQEHGISFGQYLLDYRIERACEGLAHPGVLAKEVAYSVGFNDLSYFSRAFKQRLGICPTQYQATARYS
ncbi:MAG: response regulator transcription factor [Polaromonas sp.]|nr:response regulator transcription factor [Polaromonas sp.]